MDRASPTARSRSARARRSAGRPRRSASTVASRIAYFKSLNEKGGINGRKIKFIVLDNGFNPPKALEASRKLVEEDGVLAEVGTVGTPTNSAIQKYLNGKKVPQLLVSAGGSKFNDPKQYPWTVPFYPSFEVEATATPGTR